MKRSFVLSFCAIVLSTFALGVAQADVDVALNIRYNDPADPSEGGSWTLVAKTDTVSSDGIVGLAVRFDNMPLAGVVNGSIGHEINSGSLQIGSFDHDLDGNTPNVTEYVYGQDPNDGTPTFVTGVGQTGGPSDQGTDPLRNSTWDNASVIATGSLLVGADNRPSFVQTGVNEDVSGSGVLQAALDRLNVRGDSLITLGLEDPTTSGLYAGDADRDGDVTVSDFITLQTNFPAAGVFGWDDGDFDDDGDVTVSDFIALQTNFPSAVSDPVAIGAVPEPSTAVLLMLAGGLAWRRRK